MENDSRVPLAELMRPKTLDEVVGQEKILPLLRQIARKNEPVSMIFWGPAGTGKTTLARIIANEMNADFIELSAVIAKKADVENAIEHARQNWNLKVRTILFVDEIHRFNKAQQDSLLGAVEQGVVTLIGATTENPSFEVITPLLSRCQVYVLKSMSDEELQLLLDRALSTDIILKGRKIEVRETGALFGFAGGDARKLLNIIDIVTGAYEGDVVIDDRTVTDALQQNIALYDKNGKMHYDVISAFIKSIRGSDPDAAVYYLARMLAGGEDPKFIARRLVILAAEDIGLANPNALLLANACFDTVHKIGMPEGQLPLSQATVYLATSPKSNSTAMAIWDAMSFVGKDTNNRPVPLHIRNAPTKLMKQLDYGKDYKYAHSFDGNFVEQEFMPAGLEGKKFYDPGNNPKEAEIAKHLETLWKGKY
jgi:putative ATPase